MSPTSTTCQSKYASMLNKSCHSNTEPPVTDLLGPCLYTLPILAGLCRPLPECQFYQQKWSKHLLSATDSVHTGILAHITKQHSENPRVCYCTTIRRDCVEHAHPTPKLCQPNACSTARPRRQDGWIARFGVRRAHPQSCQVSRGPGMRATTSSSESHQSPWLSWLVQAIESTYD